MHIGKLGLQVDMQYVYRCSRSTVVKKKSMLLCLTVCASETNQTEMEKHKVCDKDPESLRKPHSSV